MSTKGLKHLGADLPTEAIIAYNRSGGQRLKGDVLMRDLLASATETTSIEPGGRESIFANLVLATTAGVDAGFGCVVLLDETCDDNERGLWLQFGFADVRAADDDVATTDVDAGDNITVLNGDHDVEAVATGDPKMGIALQNAAASGSPGGSSLIRCIWWGGKYGCGLPTSA